MTPRHTGARTPDLKDVESGSDADATPAVDTDTRGDDVPAPMGKPTSWTTILSRVEYSGNDASTAWGPSGATPADRAGRRDAGSEQLGHPWLFRGHPGQRSRHHFHFQILVLDKRLELPATADRDDLLAAAEGHIIAKGELVGLYEQTVEPPK